jgi:hypothetical protein
MKRLTWTLLRLVTEAKGYNLKEMSSRLRKSFPQLKGLSTSSLHDKADEGTEAPPEVAKFVTGDSTEIRQGYEVPAKVVRMGLAAWRGKPSPAIGKRLDVHGEKLDTLLTEVAAIRTVLKVAVHVTGTVLLIVGWGFAGHQLRADVSSAETTNATQVPPVSDAAKGATGAPGIVVYLRAVLGGVLDLGKKAEENWIPKSPYPGQKSEKDCDASIGEEAINGGCWVPVERSRKAPPCGKLFRHGDICYRPVTADPNKPVGMFPVELRQP